MNPRPWVPDPGTLRPGCGTLGLHDNWGTRQNVTYVNQMVERASSAEFFGDIHRFSGFSSAAADVIQRVGTSWGGGAAFADDACWHCGCEAHLREVHRLHGLLSIGERWVQAHSADVCRVAEESDSGRGREGGQTTRRTDGQGGKRGGVLWMDVVRQGNRREEGIFFFAYSWSSRRCRRRGVGGG